jgi:hypothetical protein
MGNLPPAAALDEAAPVETAVAAAAEDPEFPSAQELPALIPLTIDPAVAPVSQPAAKPVSQATSASRRGSRPPRASHAELLERQRAIFTRTGKARHAETSLEVW